MSEAVRVGSVDLCTACWKRDGHEPGCKNAGDEFFFKELGSKCEDCGADAPRTGRFIEPKPLIDGKWLCDGCWERAYKARPVDDA